jgi:hypothetical protein
MEVGDESSPQPAAAAAAARSSARSSVRTSGGDGATARVLVLGMRGGEAALLAGTEALPVQAQCSAYWLAENTG